MLYLIINEKGEPEHRWSTNPDKDFEGLTVIGKAITDIDGLPEDSAVLKFKDGVVTVDEDLKKAKKEAEEKAKEDAKKDQDERTEALSELKAVDMSKIKTLGELQSVVELIRTILV